jgi:hypothetical protein
MQMIDAGGSDLCTALSLGQSVEISRPLLRTSEHDHPQENTIVITN